MQNISAFLYVNVVSVESYGSRAGIGGYDFSSDTYLLILREGATLVFSQTYKNRVIRLDWKNSPLPFRVGTSQRNEICLTEIHMR